MAEDSGQRSEGRQLFCRVITPEEVIYDGEADLIIARIADGDLQVLVEEAVSVEDIDVEAAEDRVEEAERELSEVSEEAEDRDRVVAEIERRQRMGENLVRLARKYNQS